MTPEERINVLEAELNFAAVQLKDWHETWVRNGSLPLPQEFERTYQLITKTINGYAPRPTASEDAAAGL